MQVTLKLFASLNKYLPVTKISNVEALIEVPEGTNIGTVIETYQIPEKSAHLVMVNGKYIEPSARMAYVLQANDALAICPPVAGG
jgi:molybdopterin converting factor small subunit